MAQICGLSAGGIECREAAYMRSYVKSFLCWEHAPWALPDTAGDQKAPNAYLWLELSDHMTAVTANHSGHMTQMLASVSRHLDALKGLEGGGRKGLRRFSLPVITLTKMFFVCICWQTNETEGGNKNLTDVLTFPYISKNWTFLAIGQIATSECLILCDWDKSNSNEPRHSEKITKSSDTVFRCSDWFHFNFSG